MFSLNSAVSARRNDADLIEILWKQDVDLGIPYEDYTSPATNKPLLDTYGSALPSKELAPCTKTPKDNYEGEAKATPNTTFDQETGEPIFASVAGPSSLNLHTDDSLLAELESLLRRADGNNASEAFTEDWASSCLGAAGIDGSVASAPPFNSTDPFSGVLFQNATLPSTVDNYFNSTEMNNADAWSANGQSGAGTSAMSMGLQSKQGELPADMNTRNGVTMMGASGASSSCQMGSGVADNSLNFTGTASWDLLGDFLRDELANNTNLSHDSLNSSLIFNAVNLTESVNTLSTALTDNNQRMRQISERTPSSSGCYTGSDAGVSSMFSDDGHEDWLDSGSQASSSLEQDHNTITPDGSPRRNDTSLQGATNIFPRTSITEKNAFYSKQRDNVTVDEIEPEVRMTEGNEASLNASAFHNPHVDNVHHNHSYAMHSDAMIALHGDVMHASDGATGWFIPPGSDVIKQETNSSSTMAGSSQDGYLSSDPSDYEPRYRGSVTSSRDERRARELNIPISTDDIVSLSIDEFNERLARYELTEPQHALIKDIRRRGKNKVAAQNCRKRKLDQISGLQQEVDKMVQQQRILESVNENLCCLEQRAKRRYESLCRFLRDQQQSNDLNNGSVPPSRPRVSETGAIPKTPRQTV